MVVFVTLLSFLFSIATADSLVSYISIYADRTGDGTPAAVEATGFPFYDDFLNQLPDNEPPTLNDVVASPAYMVVPSPRGTPYLRQYYAARGLSSILEEPVLRPVFAWLKDSEDKVGLLLRPRSSKDPALLGLVIDEVITPDNFTFGDFAKVAVGNLKIPFLLLAEKAYIEGLNLKSIEFIGRLGLTDKNKVSIS